jgi:hypothetical protein
MLGEHICTYFAATALFFASPAISVAQKTYKTYVPLKRIEQTLDNLKDYYGDISSGIDCATDKYPAARTICKSNYLQRLALLSSRVQAYARENEPQGPNQIKAPVDHANFRPDVPKSCGRSIPCIYEFFKSKIDPPLGAESPFAN